MNTTDNKYIPLKIDFKIPDDLAEWIDKYITYLNNSDHSSKDYYETEIQLELNFCYREALLTDEQIETLRNYYEYGGILGDK